MERTPFLCAAFVYAGFGILMEPDMDEAFQWYKKGAESDDMDEEAVYRLALCYALGKGVKKDVDYAEKLCRKAWPLDDAGMESMKDDFYNGPNDLSSVLLNLRELIGDIEIKKQLGQLIDYLKTTPVKK